MSFITWAAIALLVLPGTVSSMSADPSRVSFAQDTLTVVWSVQKSTIPLPNGHLDEIFGRVRLSVPIGQRIAVGAEAAVLQDVWAPTSSGSKRQIRGVPSAQLTYHYRQKANQRSSIGASVDNRTLRLQHQYRAVHDPLLFTSKTAFRVVHDRKSSANDRWHWSGQVLFAANAHWGLGMGLEWSRGGPAIRPTIVWNLESAQITGTVGFSPMDNAAVIGLSLQLASPSP